MLSMPLEFIYAQIISEINFPSGITSRAISAESESGLFRSKATAIIANSTDSLSKQMAGWGELYARTHLRGVFNCSILVSL